MARSRGGDVQGTCKTDIDGGVGSPTTVAEASFDPGYDIDGVLKEGYASKADMKQGYCSYGKGIGEGRK